MLAFTFERSELFFTDVASHLEAHAWILCVCVCVPKLFSQCACVFVQPSNLLRRMVDPTAMLVWTYYFYFSVLGDQVFTHCWTTFIFVGQVVIV